MHTVGVYDSIQMIYLLLRFKNKDVIFLFV